MEFHLSLPTLSNASKAVALRWEEFNKRFHHSKNTECSNKSLSSYLAGWHFPQLCRDCNIPEYLVENCEALVQRLESLFLFQEMLLYDRYKFFTHVQREDVGKEEFLTELKLLARLSEFGEMMDTFVNERFLVGCSEETDENLCAESEESYNLASDENEEDSERPGDFLEYEYDREIVIPSRDLGDESILAQDISGDIHEKKRKEIDDDWNQNSEFTICSLPDTVPYIETVKNKKKQDRKNFCMVIQNSTDKDDLKDVFKQNLSVYNQSLVGENSDELFWNSCIELKAYKKVDGTTAATKNGRDLTYVCTFCEHFTKDEAEMLVHVQKIHKTQTCFVCSMCNTKYTSRILMHSHVLETHSTNGSVCSACGVKFVLRDQLQQHISSNHIQCDICHTLLLDLETYVEHVLTHTMDSALNHCRVCDKSFSTKRALKMHLIQLHKLNNITDSTHIVCKPCTLTFPDKETYLIHKKTYHGRSKMLYKCDICDKEMNNNANLQIHIRKHTREKPYVCEVCGKRFSQTSTMNRHARVHTGEKPYKCQYCEKTFGYTSTRLLHERWHRQEKPFTCEQCGKSFRTAYYLKIHAETHKAVREKPFKCEECGSVFVSRKNLRKHRVTHLAQKPYSCERCGSSFTRLENLKNHQKSTACR